MAVRIRAFDDRGELVAEDIFRGTPETNTGFTARDQEEDAARRVSTFTVRYGWYLGPTATPQVVPISRVEVCFSEGLSYEVRPVHTRWEDPSG